MFEFIYNYSKIEIFFLCIGFLGQGIFASRFVVQWLSSEKKVKVIFLKFLVFKYIWWFRITYVCYIQKRSSYNNWSIIWYIYIFKKFNFNL